MPTRLPAISPQITLLGDQDEGSQELSDECLIIPSQDGLELEGALPKHAHVHPTVISQTVCVNSRVRKDVVDEVCSGEDT